MFLSSSVFVPKNTDTSQKKGRRREKEFSRIPSQKEREDKKERKKENKKREFQRRRVREKRRCVCGGKGEGGVRLWLLDFCLGGLAR